MRVGFPGSSASEESAYNAGDLSSIPGSGRSSGKGSSYPLQYSCLENPHGQRSLAGYSPWDHRVGHDCGTNCITKNGILPLVTACVDLEGIMLSEISQVEKDNVRSHLYVKSKKSRFAFSLSLVS